MKLDQSQKGTKKGQYPKPRGENFNIVGPPDPKELAKLDQTRTLGGLVPERDPPPALTKSTMRIFRSMVREMVTREEPE
jgi:hypothetical protein